MRTISALVSAFIISVVSLAGCAAVPLEGAQPTLPLSSLTIDTARGQISFTVELADEPNEIQTGMMFRQSIGENEGMLFDLGRTRAAFFWMRNTYISLDIIFIDPEGRVINIAADATPLSEQPLYSDRSARGVLEIRGGGAAAFGIEPGDLVRHELFGTDALGN